MTQVMEILTRVIQGTLFYIVKTMALTIWRDKEAGRASAVTTWTNFFQTIPEHHKSYIW